MLSPEELSGFTVLSRLTPQQRAAVADLSRTVRFEPGMRLFDEGDAADRCWLIRSGRVTLDSLVAGHGRLAIQDVGPDEVLGWSWLVAPHTWHFGAVVEEPTVAVEINAGALRRLADDDPALGYPLVLALFEALLTRLTATRERLLELAAGRTAGSAAR